MPPGAPWSAPTPSPQLSVPPGYVGYHGGPVGSLPLKRTRGVERAAAILVGASAVLSIVPLLVARTVTDDAQAFLDDEITRQEFLERVAPYSLSSILPGIANIAAVVLVIIWMYRIATNHRRLQRTGTWGPGWAIGGWFAPPILYVIPFLMFRELWKASDPDVPLGGDWRSGTVSPLVPLWFVVYSIGGLVLGVAGIGAAFGGIGGGETALAEQLTGSVTLSLVGVVQTLVSAALFVMLATRLGDRHRRLTGERPD